MGSLHRPDQAHRLPPSLGKWRCPEMVSAFPAHRRPRPFRLYGIVTIHLCADVGTDCFRWLWEGPNLLKPPLDTSILSTMLSEEAPDCERGRQRVWHLPISGSVLLLFLCHDIIPKILRTAGLQSQQVQGCSPLAEALERLMAACCLGLGPESG